MDSLIEKMLAELGQQQAVTEPILEGFGDDARVGLLAHPVLVAQEGIQVYARRIDLILTAIAALTALRDHHYPLLPRFSVPRVDMDNFENQLDTMKAAHGQLDVEEPVVSGLITFRNV